MSAFITKPLVDKINKNWEQLECSYLGGPLQSMGIAPGDPQKTAEKCRNSQFSSMFSKSMGDNNKNMNLMNSTMGVISQDLNKFKDVIGSIKKQIGRDVATIAEKFFDIYKRLAKIVIVFMRHLNNIVRIFRDSYNLLFGFYWSLGALINLLSSPINALAALVELFARTPSPIAQSMVGVGSIIGSGMKNIPKAIEKKLKKLFK